MAKEIDVNNTLSDKAAANMDDLEAGSVTDLGAETLTAGTINANATDEPTTTEGLQEVQAREGVIEENTGDTGEQQEEREGQEEEAEVAEKGGKIRAKGVNGKGEIPKKISSGAKKAAAPKPKGWRRRRERGRGRGRMPG